MKNRFHLIALLALPVSTVVFMASPTLLIAAIMRISDRGLSYSINRASKELLYVPIDPFLIYQAKAWIDMFGYRIFKVMGSVLILLFTQWTVWQVSVPELGWLTLVICATWVGVIVALRSDYQLLPDVVGSRTGRAR